MSVLWQAGNNNTQYTAETEIDGTKYYLSVWLLPNGQWQAKIATLSYRGGSLPVWNPGANTYYDPGVAKRTVERALHRYIDQLRASKP